MTIEEFDFRRPGRLPDFVDGMLSAWEEKLARELSGRWGRQFGSPVEVEAKGTRLARSNEVIARYSPESMASRVLVGEGKSESFICFSRETTRQLVTGLLGETPQAETEAETEVETETDKEDRELTELELTLANLLFEEFASALCEAKPEQLDLNANASSAEPWEEIVLSMDSEDDMVILCFEVGAPFTGLIIEWVLPVSVAKEFALRVFDSTGVEKQGSELEHLVKQLPIEVVIRLGNRQLEMAQLANLKPGDVLVLDQRIDQPLVALVDGIPKYEGWPGKSGTRQAFQVHLQNT